MMTKNDDESWNGTYILKQTSNDANTKDSTLVFDAEMKLLEVKET